MFYARYAAMTGADVEWKVICSRSSVSGAWHDVKRAAAPTNETR